MRFKVGDKVRIKSIDWYNRYTNGTEVDCGAYPFTSDMKEFCGQERIIANVCQECYLLLGIDDRFVWTDEMIEGLVEEEVGLDKAGQITDFEYEGLAYTLPEGYQFKDENGNVISTTKIVLEKKKKEYPKTYGGCCDTLYINSRHDECYEACLQGYPMQTFARLLICRDAYWKIAGDEMGLGEPWIPVYQDDKQDKHCIYVDIWGVTLHQDNIVQHVLSFPTKEMRDAFYENFKEEIDKCKELL